MTKRIRFLALLAKLLRVQFKVGGVPYGYAVPAPGSYGSVIGHVVGYHFTDGIGQTGWMTTSAIGGYIDPDLLKTPSATND